jgi:hypothetical protein
MMAKTLEGRYPTPARAASALEMFLAAGAMQPSSPDLDPEMAPYLQELEKQQPPPSSATIPAAAQLLPGGKPSSGTIPAAPPLPMKPPRSTTEPAETSEKKNQGTNDKRGKKVPRPEKATRGRGDERKQARPKLPPPPPASADALPTVNVELVAMPSRLVSESDEEDLFRPLTRRDFLVFFSGVGLVVIAYVIGLIMARLLFGRRTEPKPEENPPANS